MLQLGAISIIRIIYAHQATMITFASQRTILSYPSIKYNVKTLDGMIDSVLPS